MISALSTELVTVTITATPPVGDPVDPTGSPIQIAILPDRQQPGESDWQDADWGSSIGAGQYTASLLVGPDGGAITLTPGNFTVWAQLTAPPEQPVIRCDPLLYVY